MQFIQNKFIANYFLIENSLPHGLDREQAFFALAKIYNLKSPEALFSLSQNREVQEIDSINKFYLYERLKSISAIKKTNSDFSDMDEMISLKGHAFVFLEESKVITRNFLSDTEIISNLAQKASAGIIAAMIVYGFALCEGLCVPKNISGGVRILKKAAAWNSPEACVMCMAYDFSNAQKYADILTSTSACPYQAEVQALAEPYRVIPKRDELAHLLEKAFARGIAKREQYDHFVARVIYAQGLKYIDKWNAVLSGDKGYLLSVNNLPLNILEIRPRTGCLRLPFERSAEQLAVQRGLSGSHLVSRLQYRPLLLCGDEEYVLDTYEKAICEYFGDCNVRVIDISKADSSLFEYGVQNVLVCGLEEKRENVVIFRMCGMIEAGKERLIKAFLNTAQRRDLKLANGLSLNLSNVLPILLCDGANARPLKAYCNVIELSAMNDKEKQCAILSSARNTAKEFGMSGIKFDKKALSLLMAYPIDDVLSAIEKAFMSLDGENVISFENLQPYLKSMQKPMLGFRSEA